MRTSHARNSGDESRPPGPIRPPATPGRTQPAFTRSSPRRSGQHARTTALAEAADAVQAAADRIEGRWDDRALLVEYQNHADTLWSHASGPTIGPRLLRLRLCLRPP